MLFVYELNWRLWPIRVLLPDTDNDAVYEFSLKYSNDGHIRRESDKARS